MSSKSFSRKSVEGLLTVNIVSFTDVVWCQITYVILLDCFAFYQAF